MTEKELVNVFVMELSRVRGLAAESIGWPSVLAVEGLGMVIVPSWVPEMLSKLAKLAALVPGNPPEIPDSSTPSGGVDRG